MYKHILKERLKLNTDRIEFPQKEGLGEAKNEEGGFYPLLF
jgi:hypothetical protein